MGWFAGAGWTWFGIPLSLGITCIALLQLFRLVRKDGALSRRRVLENSADGKNSIYQEEQETWQVNIALKCTRKAQPPCKTGRKIKFYIYIRIFSIIFCACIACCVRVMLVGI